MTKAKRCTDYCLRDVYDACCQTDEGCLIMYDHLRQPGFELSKVDEDHFKEQTYGKALGG